jgi:acyl-CoA thioesterase-1
MMDMRGRSGLLLLMLALGSCDRADTRDAAGGIETARAEAPAREDTASRAPADGDARHVILFLGTSLTAGFGVGEENAFPALIQAKIDSAGLPWRVVNAGLSGETSAGGLRRLDWSLQEPIDVLVLELGANDGLRGLPVAQLRANLDTIITRTLARYPNAHVVLAGMEAPPNLGTRYTTEFHRTFPALARKHHAVLVPFLLEGVGGHADLNQADAIHPTPAGHRIIADNVWKALRPLLAEKTEH